MIKGVLIRKLDKMADQRGWLAEIYRADETDHEPVMGYVSLTKPGIARGPHEHKYQSDCFVFTGPGNFELYLWDNRKDSKINKEHVKLEVGEKNPSVVIIPPGVVHGYKCISDDPAWCINLPDKLYMGKGKKEKIDEIRWENVDDSPYKMN